MSIDLHTPERPLTVVVCSTTYAQSNLVRTQLVDEVLAVTVMAEYECWPLWQETGGGRLYVDLRRPKKLGQ